jgi:hypothetical protein
VKILIHDLNVVSGQILSGQNTLSFRLDEYGFGLGIAGQLELQLL